MSESPEERLSNHSGGKWTVCHQEFPKNEIIYLTQVVLIYIVVCACIYNLTSGQKRKSGAVVIDTEWMPWIHATLTSLIVKNKE